MCIVLAFFLAVGKIARALYAYLSSPNLAQQAALELSYLWLQPLPPPAAQLPVQTLLQGPYVQQAVGSYEMDSQVSKGMSKVACIKACVSTAALSNSCRPCTSSVRV